MMKRTVTRGDRDADRRMTVGQVCPNLPFRPSVLATLVHVDDDKLVGGPEQAAAVISPVNSTGVIVLAAIADTTTVSIAMLVAAVACAVAAPLYVPAWRAERRRRATPQPGTPLPGDS